MQLLDRIFVPGGGIRAARHRILVVNGHPDPRPARFCSALCDAYEEGARSAGWTVRRLTVGCLASGPAGLRNGCSQETALEDIAWATQLFVVFPLWSDQPPQSYATCSRNMSRSTGWTGGLCPSDRFAWHYYGNVGFPPPRHAAMRYGSERHGRDHHFAGIRRPAAGLYRQCCRHCARAT
jgi:hypothetical protein